MSTPIWFTDAHGLHRGVMFGIRQPSPAFVTSVQGLADLDLLPDEREDLEQMFASMPDTGIWVLPTMVSDRSDTIRLRELVEAVGAFVSFAEDGTALVTSTPETRAQLAAALTNATTPSTTMLEVVWDLSKRAITAERELKEMTKDRDEARTEIEALREQRQVQRFAAMGPQDVPFGRVTTVTGPDGGEQPMTDAIVFAARALYDAHHNDSEQDEIDGSKDAAIDHALSALFYAIEHAPLIPKTCGSCKHHNHDLCAHPGHRTPQGDAPCVGRYNQPPPTCPLREPDQPVPQRFRVGNLVQWLDTPTKPPATGIVIQVMTGFHNQVVGYVVRPDTAPDTERYFSEGPSCLLMTRNPEPGARVPWVR